MLIYLLRHGDAAQDPSLHDSERPLTALGIRQAETVARFLSRSKSTINAIFCSTLHRAQQTASPIESVFPQATFTLTEYLVPGNDSRQLLDLVNRNIVDSILFVGHEPYLSELGAQLIGGNTETRIEFKKSSLALVETTPPVRKGRGILKWLITVDLMGWTT